MKEPENHVGKNPLEWSVFVASCGVVIAAVVALIVLGLREKDGPPLLEVRIEPAVVGGGRVVVPVVINNRGHGVAAEVEVVVRGHSGNRIREGRVAVDFIPRGATRRGAVSFAGADVPEEWVAEVAGFREP